MSGMNADTENDYDEEIDPTVYLKCRLCITENGAFPIQQYLQQQIQYCFDIYIKQFDRLPQLICKKCKIILKDFHSTKRTYLENQDKLHLKLNLGKNKVSELENEAEHIPTELEPESKATENAETVSADVEPEDDLFQRVEEESVTSTKSKAKKRKNRILSHSSNSDDDIRTLPTNIDKNKSAVNKNSRDRKKSLTWKNSFDEYFICRFCKVPFFSREVVLRHIKTHGRLLNRSNKYVKRHCRVTLEKIDEKMNLTGVSKTVVVGPKNIVYDEGHMHYYIKYLPSDAKLVLIDENSTRSKSKSMKRIRYFDDSSDDDFDDSSDDDFDDSADDDFEEKRQQKKRRKMSRSSSRDTVVLDGDDKRESNARTRTTNPELAGDNDVMYIDDTSIDSNTQNKQKEQKSASGDSLTKIKNIIKELLTKYTGSTNKESIKRPTVDVMLNRKLLSVGRKTMSNKGLPTPGLTVYLNKKNLPVTWFPILGSKKNYVRIITTVDVSGKDPLSKWSAVKPNEDINNTEVAEVTPRIAEITPVVANSTAIVNTPPLTLSTTIASESTSKVAESTPQATTKDNEKSQNNVDAEPNVQDIRELSGLNYFTGDPSEPLILNAYPVANPKQLPKKHSGTFTGTTSTHTPDLDEIRPESDHDPSMPIILSTTSLAEQSGISNETNTITSADKTKDTMNKPDTANPRIKCKPVSELLARQPIDLLERTVPNNVTQAKFAGNSVTVPNNVTQAKSVGNSVTVTNNVTQAKSVGNSVTVPNNVTQAKSVGNSVTVPNNVTQAKSVGNSVTVPNNVTQAKSVGNSVVLQPNVKPLKIVSVKPVPLAAAAAAAAAQARADDPRVTLNSTHLPNMSTTQPIEYLKQCLNMHSITLLTLLGTKLTPSFVCLIKFRLDISLNDQSIVLNLALFGQLSSFCLKLRNPNGEEIDIDNLSSHWQLHILRSFQNNDVSMKLLSCASKVNKSLHENATKFITVIGDIESV